MNKVQLTLTTQEVDIISAKAAQLGYNLTRYIKFIIGREAAELVEQSKIPSFKLSKKAEKIGLEAIKEYEAGKAKKINSFANI